MLCAPCLAIAGAYFMATIVYPVEEAPDIERLLAAILIASLVSFSFSMFRDNRSLILNMKSTINYQIATLPAIPLIFCLLSQYWPKSIDLLFLDIALAIGFLAPIIYWRTIPRPWRVKEAAAELIRAAPTSDLRKVQAEVKTILQQLTAKNLMLKDATDHNDRADTYRLLADLQVKQMQFIDAEKNYHAAVDSYNDALKIDADNRISISNKFNTVEAIKELKRTRF